MRTAMARLAVLSGIAASAGLGWIALSVNERRAEAEDARRGPEIPEQQASQSSLWANRFPYQYSGYVAGTEPGNPSHEIVDELSSNPNLVSLWAGYGFAKDYNKPRGHAFAVLDIYNTLRTGGPLDDSSGPMPATCWSCKSPDVPRVMQRDGIGAFYEGKWARLGHEVVNPIGCADCHNAKTGALQVSRPALKEAMDRRGTPLEQASHQEMRSLVCAQCHAEYYFKKEGNYLTFPWDQGTTAEEVEAYYDQAEFQDWTHALSKAPMLKAQHPGYELFKMGIHGKRGVACADCHMPYKMEGGVKISDHHVRSPLTNIANACQQCHRQSEQELISNLADFKKQIESLKKIVEEELVHAHWEAKKAWDLGATVEQMQKALKHIRHGQWRWDYAVAAHGAYFHAPEEVLRTLGIAIKAAADARSELRMVLGVLDWNEPVALPDLSSKAKAQAAVGLDMNKLMEEKRIFKEKIVGEWQKQAQTLDQKLLEKIEH